MIINNDFVEQDTYDLIYNKGYAAGSLSVTSEILNEFIDKVRASLTDAVCERHVEGVCNLMNDVKREMGCNNGM